MNGPLRINLAYYQNQTLEFRDPATQAYAHALYIFTANLNQLSIF